MLSFDVMLCKRMMLVTFCLLMFKLWALTELSGKFQLPATEVYSFVGAASAANSLRSDGLFAAKAAPTFAVVQIKNNKTGICLCDLCDKNFYRINPLSLGEPVNLLKSILTTPMAAQQVARRTAEGWVYIKI